MAGNYELYILSSRGELTKGGPSGWWVSEWIKTPHRKNQHFAKYYT
jgi:hypothetical protein